MEKSYILDEIRRTASVNAGSPLGWRRFVVETGIKQSDWFAIYWARWSDALREAGFEPNQLTEAYGTSQLLEIYAEFVVELGRLPATADLRLKARNDPTFPHDATFARMGTKLQLAQQVASFCRGRNGYDLVADLCDQYVSSRLPNRPSDDSAQGDDVEFGFVYLMKSGRFHKIGHSNAAGRREYELAIQLPEKLKTIHVIRTDDPTGIEAYWHNRFKDKRKNGEWFDLTAPDVAAFKRRKFM